MTSEQGSTLPVPVGRRIDLPGRGRGFVREAGAANARHTVLLVHGWLASGGLNWSTSFEPLAEHFRVVAPDLRGHGRGIRTNHRFQLEDCADDLAVLIDTLGCGPVIVAGYSMGGLVAQLLWQRRPDLVSGLVLCSTTRRFDLGRRQRYVIAAGMYYAASTVRASRWVTRWYWPEELRPTFRTSRPTSLRVWTAAEMRRHDMRQLLEAGYAACRFSSRRWIGEVDIPTAVVVTTQDRAIPPDAQLDLAASIDGATVFTIDEDHLACGYPAYANVLVEACRDVAVRIPPP